MRRNVIILFLSICLFNFFESRAQSSFPFPTENAIWTEEQHLFPNDTITVHYGMIGDTLIKGFTYKKVFTSKDSVFKETNKDLSYYGALRNEGNKTFLLPKPRYAFDTTEYVIFDANFAVGDTLDGGNVNSELVGLLTVYSIDSIRLMDNTLRRRWNFKRSFYLTNGNPIRQDCGFSWVEGLGNTKCPFEEPFICSFRTNDANRLLSFEQDNEKIYADSGYSECNLDSTVSTNEQEFLPELSLFPNPTTGIFFLQTSDNSYETINIKIIDSSGKLILEYAIDFSRSYQLNIEHLPAGIYFIIFQNGFSFQKQKLIKI